MQKLVGQTYTNNLNQQYTVTSLDGKEHKKTSGYAYFYTVVFKATQNEYEAQERSKVKAGKCKDLKAIKLDHQKKKAQKIKERNKLSKESIADYEHVDNLSKKVSMSIDGATYATGYAISENKAFLETGNIFACKLDDVSDRMVFMTAELEKLIVKHKVEVVFYEYIFLKNFKTSVILARLMGMIEYIALKNGCKFILISPISWKSYFKLGVDREQQKKNSIIEAQKFFDKEILEDEADAIHILRYCIKTLERENQ